MTNYDRIQKFQALHFPRDAIGLESGETDTACFCTPVGAEIIGWTGCDGIHFCLIPSVSAEIVFVVSPLPCGDRYVDAVARNFLDFLSLVLFCKSANPIADICWMEEKQFLEQIKSEEETAYPERDAALNTLQKAFHLTPLPNAYQYVKQLQDDFDHSLIPFSEEYYDILGIERVQ